MRKKSDLKTINGYFIDYVEKFKSHKFHCPLNSTRNIELRNT